MVEQPCRRGGGIDHEAGRAAMDLYGRKIDIFSVRTYIDTYRSHWGTGHIPIGVTLTASLGDSESRNRSAQIFRFFAVRFEGAYV